VFFFSDAEGDHIAFSSEDELMEAVKNAENNIFKIYISGKFLKQTALPAL
jgi:hypothetical protein